MNKTVDDFELDTIFEVSAGDSSYWLTEESYKNILRAIKDMDVAVKIETLYGIESTLIVQNITAVDKSTRAQRVLSRELNQKYREREIVEGKKEWE